MSSWPGLTTAEAEARLAADGPNAIASAERRSPFRLIFDVIREPMFLLLIAAGALYVAFGDLREAATLLGFVVIVIVITVVQEGRTERALDALRELSSPRAQVLRDGQVVTLAGRLIVRGDIIRVAEGDRVPADALLRDGTALSVDESLLTGESVPVAKVGEPDAAAMATPGTEGGGALYSGTVVVAGRGLAEVMATGPRSQLGQIGASLRELPTTRTPLQREVGRVVQRLAVLGGALSLALVALRWVAGAGWRESLLSGITLAMALLPEEFPVVLTVFLALGAWRISKSRVLTRRVNAVETLGSVHVLCTDKTGTLTQNRMSIRRLVSDEVDLEIDGDATSELPESVHELIEVGILASPRDPFDPMEKAFWAVGRRALDGTEHLHPSWEVEREYPLRPGLLAVTHVWRTPDDGRLIVATKGAPEAVFDLCHLDDATADRWRVRVTTLARDGLRVLAVARSPELPPTAPEDPHDLPFELVGLVGLADPVRPDVPDAVALCRRAGMRVLMVTGDHPDTARAIARQAGIDCERIVTGAELEAMDDAALGACLATTGVVARAVPAHKLRIIQALRGLGLLVGMTGDGVNDAPALKAADIGIAMGARGTDVAREASDLVLVEDDFASIVAAVRTGRRVYDNLRKAVGYIVAVHLPIAGLALVPALLGWAPVLEPAHVLFLELIIDPTCSILFEMEAEEPDVMQRPPRPTGAPLFGRRAMLWAVLQGVAVFLVALGLVAWARDGGLAEGSQRAVGFAALVSGNLGILIANRSLTEPFWRVFRRPNPVLPYVLGGALGVLALVVTVPPLRRLFAFAPTDLHHLVLATLDGAAAVFALDVLKALYRRPAR